MWENLTGWVHQHSLGIAPLGGTWPLAYSSLSSSLCVTRPPQGSPREHPQALLTLTMTAAPFPAQKKLVQHLLGLHLSRHIKSATQLHVK